MRLKSKTVMDRMNAEKPEDVLADLEAKHGCAAPSGSPPTPTFIAEQSDTKFELTPQEKGYLDNLLAWQEQSAKSTTILGGDDKVENEKLTHE